MSADLNALLYDAVTRNDAEKTRNLIARGAAVNGRSTRLGHCNRTNLIQACEYGHKAVIDLLLSRGAAVNDANSSMDGNTALIVIIRRGFDNEIVDWLLKRGANVNKKNKLGLTALHWAAMINNTVVINRLVTFGATVNVKDNDGRTPLWYAACNVHVDAIHLLLSYGANPHCKCSLGKTPLHLCAEGWSEAYEGARALLEFGASPRVKDRRGRTPIDVAAKDEVEELLISWQGRVRSLQQQIKTLLLSVCSKRQLIQVPLPGSLRRWLTS